MHSPVQPWFNSGYQFPELITSFLNLKYQYLAIFSKGRTLSYSGMGAWIIQVKVWVKIIFLSVVVHHVYGGYEDPILTAMVPPLEYVEILPDNYVRVSENMRPDNFRIARIMYTDDNGDGLPVVTTDAPLILGVEMDEEGIYYLLLNETLDYEAEKNQFPVRFSGTVTIVQLDVVDLNDNHPVFHSYPTLPLRANESQIEDELLLFTYNATDLDASDVLSYGLHDLDVVDQNDSPFRIDSSTGEFFLTKTLDYEARTLHTVLVDVTDSEHRVSTPIVTTIAVVDFCDTPPRWVNVPIRININEGGPSDERWSYLAVDQDFVCKSEVEYSIKEHDDYQFFTMDPSSGELRVTADIDAEIIKNLDFELTVIATEISPSFYSINESVTVIVADINDNPPLILPERVKEKYFDVTIKEHESDYSELPIEENVGIIIMDIDATLPNHRFRMELDAEDFVKEALAISPTSASNLTTLSVLIRNWQRIDYEDERWRGVDGTVEFAVKIIPENDPDQENNTAFARIRLIIEDINDWAPEWNDSTLSFSFPETVEKDYVIGTIQAFDQDITPEFGNSSVIYRWYKRTPRFMDINNTTGEIVVTEDFAFDYETNPDESWDVEAVDMFGDGGNDQLSTIAALNLVIGDVNDEAPTIRLPSSQASVLENSTDAIFILQGIIVGDRDTSANISVTVEFITPSPRGWFIIEDDDPLEPLPLNTWQKRLVGVANRIDRELFDRVDVNITVTDLAQETGQDSTSAFLSITINDENDNPPEFTNRDDVNFIKVQETAEFLNGMDNSSDYDRQIFTFGGRDPDLYENLTFKISSEYPRMLELVQLEGTTSTAILRRKRGQMIDREERIKSEEEDTDFLYYTVYLFDNNRKHSTSIDFAIEVGDLNDNTPQFVEDYSTPYKVFEDVEADVAMGIINATDKDTLAYGTVQYFFDENFNDGIGLDKFRINQTTGEILTRGGLDRETMALYSIRVNAIDNWRQGSTTNSNTNFTTISIQILDINDNAPDFTGNLILPSKDEHSVNPEDNLGEITVVDRDEEDSSNSEISFLLTDVICSNTKVANPRSLFEISNSTNGFSVYAKSFFDDKYGLYTLTVLAIDGGTPPLNTTGHIEFRVNDENDYPPEFNNASNRRLLINENLEADPGVKLREYFSNTDYPEITATDGDDPTTGNGKIRFSLDGPNADYFDLADPTKGLIHLSRTLTTRTEPYEFSLTVSDEGNPPKNNTLDISVIAVPATNEKPIFDIAVVELNITENVYTNSPLPESKDLDITDDYNLFEETICYYIIEWQTEEEYFQLAVYTNELSIKNPLGLDREEVDVHKLIIYSQNAPRDFCPQRPNLPDQSDWDARSNMTIDITVLDVIDTPPVFTNEGILSAGILTTADPNTVIATLSATDEDLGDKLTFSIGSKIETSHPSLDDLISPLFSITPTDDFTARLSILFRPSTLLKGYFTFKLDASDSANLTTQTDCKIYIVAEENVVPFYFKNEQAFVESKREELRRALGAVFGNPCNIDSVNVFWDENGNPQADKAEVTSHFINELLSEPILRSTIDNLKFNYSVVARLQYELDLLNLVLDTPITNEGESNSEQITIYVLISAVGVVSIILIIVSVSCFFNSKSLSRRVRALTASTFGSKDSGLNRVGGDLDLPNTNQHAIQGSNPMWTTETDGKILDFDTESVGSGGSVLIGVEDDEDFKNYSGAKSNPAFDDGEDFSPINKGGVNPLFGLDGAIESDTDDGQLDAPAPRPALNIRRNPLMNLDLSGESDQ